jgi:hypothetical protein
MKIFERSVLRAQILVGKVDSIERSGLLHLTPFVSVPRVCSAALPLRFKQAFRKNAVASGPSRRRHLFV